MERERKEQERRERESVKEEEEEEETGIEAKQKSECEAKEREERFPVSGTPSTGSRGVAKNEQTIAGIFGFTKKESSGLPPPVTSRVPAGVFDDAGKPDFTAGKKVSPGVELRTPSTKKNGKRSKNLSNPSKVTTPMEPVDTGKPDILEDSNTNNASVRVSVSSENERFTDMEHIPSPTMPTPPSPTPEIPGFSGLNPARRRNDSAQSQITAKSAVMPVPAPAPVSRKSGEWGSWGSSLINNLADAERSHPSGKKPIIDTT